MAQAVLWSPALLAAGYLDAAGVGLLRHRTGHPIGY